MIIAFFMLYKMCFFIFLSVIFIVGCNGITGDIINSGELIEKIPIKLLQKTDPNKIREEINQPPQVFFCRETSCEKIFISLIESAQNYAHCAFYDLDLNDLVIILKEKSKNIDVKLVIDSDNYENQFNNNMVSLDTKKQYSHNKFCVFDGTTIVTGSFNPTENGETKNDNNIIVIYSQYIAENYENEFQELFSGIFGSGLSTKNKKIILNNNKFENYFCPEDNCQDQIITEILQAKQSIYFMTFSFTSEEIADALLLKPNIEIKGIFEKRGANGKYSQYPRLKDFGLDVITDNNPYTMHHKVFIIDKETVITGSMNPTKSGNTRNDENIVIIHDLEIAKEFLEEFERISGSFT